MLKSGVSRVGAMAVISGLYDEVVTKVCTDVEGGGKKLFPLSTLIRWDNIVIAGHKQAVDRAIDAAKKLGL